MPKPLHPPKWYLVGDEPGEGGSAFMSEVADQPAFAGKADARKWLLGTKDKPGNAPGSGKFLLLRQLDEQDLVVETVRTVRQAPDVPPETPQPTTTEGEDAEAEKTWADKGEDVLF